MESRKAEDLKIFEARWIRRKHPVWQRESEFIVLNSPRWVNIIPITKDNNVVFIEQYRHGIDEITLEVPGGLIEKDEDPQSAAERECTEETGFVGEASGALLVGENQPNPAFLNNICYSYVWFNCEKKAEQKLDINEDINIHEIPLKSVKEMIIKGEIKHSLVLTAFFFYFIKYNGIAI